MANKQLKVYQCNFLNVRKGPSTKYAIGFKMYKDRVVDVVSTQNGWARLKFDTSYGWASLSYLTGVKQTIYRDSTKVYKTTSKINFRREPDWNSDVLYLALKGLEVDAIDDTDETWVKIWYANMVMYAPKQYLSFTGNIKPGSGITDDSEEELPPLTEEKEPIRPVVQYKNDYWIDIHNPNNKSFRFNTSELNMHMITKPTEVFNMLKYEKYDSLNANGDMIASNNTYDTTEIDLEFYIRAENYKYIIKQLKQLIKMPSFRLTLGWNRRFFMHARLSDNIEIEEFQHDDIEAKINLSFELQPYCYAQEGVYYAKDTQTGKTFLKNNSILMNNYEESYPKLFVPIPHKSLIKADENGEKAFTITLYSYDKQEASSYTLLAHNENYDGEIIPYIYAVIDSTTGNVYEDTTDRNLNYLYKIENDFPVLYADKTLITCSSNYVDEDNNPLEFKIIPNWREL